MIRIINEVLLAVLFLDHEWDASSLCLRDVKKGRTESPLFRKRD